MTLLAEPLAPVAAAPPAVAPRQVVEHVVVGLPLLVWLVPMTRSTGGEDGPWSALVLVLLAVSAVVLRADRRLGMPVVGVAAALAVAPLVVQATSPAGWQGGIDAVGYPLFALAALVVGAWASSPARRTALVAVLGLGVVDQVMRGLTIWYARGVTSVEVRGDFDWRNTFAAWCLPGTLLALHAVLRRSGRLWWLGLVATPVGAAGIVLSTSRATQALALAGALALLVLALRERGRLLAAARGALAGLLAVGLLLLLTGPLAPGSAGGVLTGTTTRAAGGETVASGTTYRLSFVKQALAAWRDHLWTGNGLGSLGQAAVRHAAPGVPVSIYAHSSVPQALSDGGLVLGLPLVVALVLLLVRAVRLVVGALLRGTSDGGLGAAVAVAATALAVHACADFDTSRPSVAVLGGVLAGVLLAVPSAPAVRLHRMPRQLSAGLLAVAVLAAGGDALARHQEQQKGYDRPTTSAQAVAWASSPWASATEVDQMMAVLVADPSADPSLLRKAVTISGPLSRDDLGVLSSRVVLEARAGLPTAADLAVLLDQASRRATQLQPAGTSARAAGRSGDVAVLVQDRVDTLGSQTAQAWTTLAAARSLAGDGPWFSCLLGRVQALPAGDVTVPADFKNLVGAADLTGDGCRSLEPTNTVGGSE